MRCRKEIVYSFHLACALFSTVIFKLHGEGVTLGVQNYNFLVSLVVRNIGSIILHTSFAFPIFFNIISFSSRLHTQRMISNVFLVFFFDLRIISIAQAINIVGQKNITSKLDFVKYNIVVARPAITPIARHNHIWIHGIQTA